MNKKIITFGAVFLCLILILGVGFFFLSGQRNDGIGEPINYEIQEEFIPTQPRIGDNGIEVNEEMFLENRGDVTYTAYSEDVPNGDNGKRTLIISSGIRNVYEDGGWKKIENARSLLNSGINFKTTEYDERYGYEIIDFNYTNVKFKPVINDNGMLNRNVPIKRNGQVENNINYNNKNQREEIEFNNINTLNNNFTIGEHSTTFQANSVGTSPSYMGVVDPFSTARVLTNFVNTPTEGGIGIRDYNPDWYIWRLGVNFSTAGIPLGSTIIGFNVSFHVLNDYNYLKTNFSFTGKIGTWGEWTKGSGDTAKNFTGWVDSGTEPYGGANITIPFSTGNITTTIGAYNFIINVSSSSAGVNYLQSNIGSDFKIMFLAENDINGTAPPDSTNELLLFGSGFAYAPVLYVEYTVSPISLGLNNLILNSTYGTNYSSEDLIVSFIPSVNNIDTPIYANISWLRYSVINYTINNTLLTNGTFFESKLKYANTTKNETWHVTINASYTGGVINNQTNYLTILNSPPTTPNIIYPIDNFLTANYTINLSCAGSSDYDNDEINYEFYADLTTNPPTTLVNNATNQSIIYSIDNEGNYYWRCRTNDNSSVSSYTTTRKFLSNRILINSTSQTYSTYALESSTQTFKINLTYNKLTTSDVNVVFNYNHTNYTATKTNEGNERISFSSTLTTPIIESSPLTKGFGWNFTITQLNGTLILNNTYTGSQILEGLTLINCTSGNRTINFLIKDEDTPATYLNSTLEMEFEYWKGDPSVTKKYNAELEDNYNYTICLSNVDDTTYANGYIRNTAEDSFTHRYYFYNLSLTNATQYIDLFNFNVTTGKSDLKITLRDKNTYNYYSNIIGSLQRRYITEGVWRTVQMYESDDFGLNFFNVIEETTDYKLVFKDKSNNILKTSDQMSFACTSGVCELTFLLDPFSTTATYQELTYDLDYGNETGLITLSWNDPTGATSSVRLHVTKETMTGTSEICNPTGTGSVGTLTCDVSAYTGEVYVRVFDSASPEKPTITRWMKLVSVSLGNLIPTKDAVFWAFGIMITIIGFGIIISPMASVITTIIGLITLLFLGLFAPLTITFVIIACIIGIVVGLMIRR